MNIVKRLVIGFQTPSLRMTENSFVSSVPFVFMYLLLLSDYLPVKSGQPCIKCRIFSLIVVKAREKF